MLEELLLIKAELEKRASEQEADKLEAEAEASNSQAEADRQKADAARMKEARVLLADALLAEAEAIQARLQRRGHNKLIRPSAAGRPITVQISDQRWDRLYPERRETMKLTPTRHTDSESPNQIIYEDDEMGDLWAFSWDTSRARGRLAPVKGNSIDWRKSKTFNAWEM